MKWGIILAKLVWQEHSGISTGKKENVEATQR